MFLVKHHPSYSKVAQDLENNQLDNNCRVLTSENIKILDSVDHILNEIGLRSLDSHADLYHENETKLNGKEEETETATHSISNEYYALNEYRGVLFQQNEFHDKLIEPEESSENDFDFTTMEQKQT